ADLPGSNPSEFVEGPGVRSAGRHRAGGRAFAAVEAIFGSSECDAPDRRSAVLSARSIRKETTTQVPSALIGTVPEFRAVGGGTHARPCSGDLGGDPARVRRSEPDWRRH